MRAKEILKGDNSVWVDVGENKTEQTKFLAWAKQNGFVWIDGKEINPEFDQCGFHMAIDKNLTIGKVGLHCWALSKNAPKKIKLNEILGE